MSASGPTVLTCSIGYSAKLTQANPSAPKMEKTNDQIRNPGRLWRADRTCDVEDRAPFAGPDRAGVGVSHRERIATPMVGCGPNGDAGWHAVRVRLAQRRTNQPARTTTTRFRRRAPDAEPNHRVRSAPKARHHLAG